MTGLKSVAGCFALVLLIGISTNKAAALCSKVNVTRPGEVYLWRGLANVFSLGMDQMAKDFTRLGIENCVFNHSGWKAAAQELIERKHENRPISYPVVIIGHSLGAGVAPEMATYLGQNGIPVAYVVMYDPVVPTRVGPNVQEIVNYYIEQPNKNKILSPMGGFSGKLDNIDLSGRGNIDHFNIDKNAELHRIAYARVVAASDASRTAQ